MDQSNTEEGGIIPKINAQYQGGTYPELFQFVHNSVMILSIHLTDTKSSNNREDELLMEEWSAQMEANINWVWLHILL